MNTAIMRQYARYVLANFPRILTQIDRDRDSLTYGSCDRNHWHYKIRDFSSAILQQSALSLAIIHDSDFPGNIYYKNKNIEEWAKACLSYLIKIQLRDGSFNEYFPYEHGIPPTAFCLFAAAETYKILRLADSGIEKMMRKACEYLVRRPEREASNQEAASIAGIYSYLAIKSDPILHKQVDSKLEALLARQTDEGWLPEYGGADTGYLSVTLDYLAEIYRLSNDLRLPKAIEKAVVFLAHFVHPDGTSGGIYGSRNTSYLLPAGFEIAATVLESPMARALSDKVFSGIQGSMTFRGIDDRYMSHYILHSFLRCIRYGRNKNHSSSPPPSLPCETEHCRYFPEAGLLTIKKNSYFAVASLKKGGVLYIFDCEISKLIHLDNGYRIYFSGLTLGETSCIDNDYRTQFESSSLTAEIEGPVRIIKLRKPSPAWHLLLRVAARFLGKHVIFFIKNKIIFFKKQSKFVFKRAICFKDHHIVITDVFPNAKNKVSAAPHYSLRHVASSKMATEGDLLADEGKEVSSDTRTTRTIISIPQQN